MIASPTSATASPGLGTSATAPAALAPRPDRGVVAIGGAEAPQFLHGLLTATVKTVAPGTASFGALLTPQGKILFDFFLTPVGDGFLIEIGRAQLADFVKRLGFYRLRAAVTIVDRSADYTVFTAWDGLPALPDGTVAFADPRLPALGHHLLVPTAAALAPTATLHDWQALRIGLGVPEGGVDFAYGDTFPHDADMDDLAGVDFKKGCFIGQEVVSRMKHRGTARKRFVVARALEPRAAWPDAGTEITCGDKTLGTLGSSSATTALALVRLDRARAAIDSGDAIEVGGLTIALELPAFATFHWPEPSAEA